MEKNKSAYAFQILRIKNTLSNTEKPVDRTSAGLCFGAITRLQVRKQRRLGALAQENVVFGPTVLAHGAFKKPGNSNGLPGLFYFCAVSFCAVLALAPRFFSLAMPELFSALRRALPFL